MGIRQSRSFPVDGGLPNLRPQHWVIRYSPGWKAMGPRFKRPVGPTREGRKVAVKGWVDFLLRMGPRGLYYAAIDLYICAMVKSCYIEDGHPTFNRNPYNGYINPYYWVDDHPLLYGNNGSLDPGTYGDSNMGHNCSICFS